MDWYGAGWWYVSLFGILMCVYMSLVGTFRSVSMGACGQVCACVCVRACVVVWLCWWAATVILSLFFAGIWGVLPHLL